MTMFWEILFFEIRYQLKQPIFYIGCALFFLMTFGAVTTDTISIGGGIGSLNRNAPYVIMQILAVMSVLGVFTATAIVANSTYKDIEHNMQSVFFSMPITKGSYLFGRFWGASIASILIFAGVVFGFILGSWMPWLEPDRIGPFTAAPYLYSMLMLVIPNLLIAGVLFFSLAALTRSMLYTYAGLVGFFVAYAVSTILTQDIQNETLASLLDPFGLAAFSIATRYWTVFEKNSMIGPTDGLLLYNRLLWLGIAAIVLLLAYKRFRFTSASGKVKKKKLDVELPEVIQPAIRTIETAQDFSLAASIRQYFQQTKLEFTSILKSIPFLVILALGVFNSIGGTSMEDLFGTPVYPVTHLLLNVIAGNFLLFAFLILTLYSGELTWKERSLNLARSDRCITRTRLGPMGLKTFSTCPGADHVALCCNANNDRSSNLCRIFQFRNWPLLKRTSSSYWNTVYLDWCSGLFFPDICEPQIYRFLVDDAFFHQQFRISRPAFGTQSLSVRKHTRCALFRHERLRPFCETAILVHFILDFCSSHFDCIDSSLSRKRL